MKYFKITYNTSWRTAGLPEGGQAKEIIMDFSQLCACESEKYVAELFEQEETQVLLRGERLGHAPIIGTLFSVWDEPDIANLKQQVWRALGAQKWHERHAPPWAVPLRVSHAELDEIDYWNLSPPQQLRYYFEISLQNSRWNFWVHPIFPIYAGGAMAHPDAPDEIRNDRELRAQFRAKALPGLDWGLCWRTPEMIEEYRQHIAGLPAHWRAMGYAECEEQLIFLAGQHAKLDSISR